MKDFSEHFTFENMTKSDSYPQIVEHNRLEAKKFIDSGIKLSQLMEDIRTLLGVPLKETSGFRGLLLTSVGGFSSTSSHTRFEALDVIPIRLTIDEAFAEIKRNSYMFPTLRKVIKEQVKGKKWLHIEVKTKDSDTLAFYETYDGKSYQRV